MGKKGKKRPAPRAKAPVTKKNARAGQMILLGVVIAGFIGAYMLWKQGAGGSLGDLTDRFILTPHARVPRPVTLDPALFTDPDTVAAYRVAKEDPDTLEHMACYCGCFNNSGHESNLDCFRDNHGAG